MEAASAAAAALSPSLWSREILELRSWASVEGWEEELTDTELAVGDSRLEFLGGYAGERDLPLPSTLPPPSFRADMSPCVIKDRDRLLPHTGISNGGGTCRNSDIALHKQYSTNLCFCYYC